MFWSILALVIALLGAGGVIYTYFTAIGFARNTKKVDKPSLPSGTYKISNVGKEGFDNVYDIELIEEEK